jgi:NADPH-dependent curcumin reductase CurA
MSGELVRWLAATPAEREHDRALEKVHGTADAALARVSAVAQVSQAAMLGTLSVAMTKREAAMLVPEDAGKFDLIATQAAIAMANEVTRMAGR